jgi:hypothetical protein
MSRKRNLKAEEEEVVVEDTQLSARAKRSGNSSSNGSSSSSSSSAPAVGGRGGRRSIEAATEEEEEEEVDAQNKIEPVFNFLPTSTMKPVEGSQVPTKAIEAFRAIPADAQALCIRTIVRLFVMKG